MEAAMLCATRRLNAIVMLLSLWSLCNFIQCPMDLGTLDLLQTTTGTSSASTDFGKIIFSSPPSAVLRPHSAMDISLLLTFLSSSPSSSTVTVAARGAGHSIHGQALAPDGIVIDMASLPPSIEIHRGVMEGSSSYADVSGGAMWVQLLEESLKQGLAPRSWTDYLYLSIGGTLSNGGISGQTFKYGPQISNVLQLEVVTGKGEVVTCSPSRIPELFYAVLGGLGQFGIITRARILLQDAPKKVRWVRAFYDDFKTFMEDQELLVSMPENLDYLEGFLVPNEQSLHSSSTAFPYPLGLTPQLQQLSSSSRSTSKVHYCIEFAVHDYQTNNADQVVEEVSKKMRQLPRQIYRAEVSYFDFLNRVRLEEMNLRGKDMWEVPHPWLNMFVPKSGILEFKDLLLETISPQDFEGPILMYPLLRDKWDGNTSAVLPESGAAERVVYVVGMLRSANSANCHSGCLRGLLRRHHRLAEAASGWRVGARQYLAHHATPARWRDHFGGRWGRFAARKERFDPLHILAPGQCIFPRARLPSGGGGGAGASPA